jgi:integrase
MAGLSYMQRRRSGIYEFRKRLPTELAGRPVPAYLSIAHPELVNPKTGRFKGEIVRSLGTSDFREAKGLDIREARKALDLFEVVRRALREPPPLDHTVPPAPGELDAADLEVIEAEALRETLARDEDERTEGDERRRLQTREERAQWPDLVPIAEPWAKGMAEDHAYAYGLEIEEEASNYRAALARRDPSIVRVETAEAHRRHQVPVDPTSPTYHSIGMAVLRGHVKAFDAMMQRQKGEVVETPPAPRPAAAKGPKLSEAFELWQEGNPATGARRPGRSGILEAKPALRWFTELHGDMRVGEITKGHAREFQRALAKVPKGLPTKLRNLPLPKLLESKLEGYEPRGATTINKSIGILAAVISHVQREGLLDAVPGFINPFGKDVKLRVDKRQDDGREPFVASDLTAMFAAGVYRQGDRPRAGAGEAAFWFPLISLLSGMRLEEIAGLRLMDLRQDEETGRWLFDVTPRGGRSVKTASSIRQVPLHTELVRIGLLRYRQSLIDQGRPNGGSLWPALKSGKGLPLSAAWSKWFSRFLRTEAGTTDRHKVFHSFRHTWKRMARDAGLREEIHDAITGHAGGGGVGKSYGRGVSLRPLIEAMDCIPAPNATAGLMWSLAGRP